MKDNRGFTLIELLVVIAIIALLISILLPSLSTARELSKRVVCAAHLKGIGTAGRIYAADDDRSQWMIPGFCQDRIDNGGIRYTGFLGCDTEGGGYNCGSAATSCRTTPSKKCNSAGQGGSTAVSVTRAFWMLVRSGDVTVKQFVCPSSDDTPDPSAEQIGIDFWYDFAGYGHISYGYMIPFGPRDTRPRDGADNRQVLVAEKGPFCAPETIPDWDVGADGPIGFDDSPMRWRRFNSPNHGGKRSGRGQNCLYGDGHVTFERRPIVGIDYDNIYTLMGGDWDTWPLYNVMHGWTVYEAPTGGDPYPGQNVWGQGAGFHASTDSLIYP